MKHARALALIALIAVVLSGAFGTAAQRGTSLTVTCRCKEGGVNSGLAQWLKSFVIPTFEAMMADRGEAVIINLVEFEDSDEALKAQYIHDMQAGAGSDIMAFDGFWIPEFVDAGLLQPLTDVVGDAVNDWDGWQHIPESAQGLMMYHDERYGLPTGTDVRMIFYRTDLLQDAGIPLPWQPASWQEILQAAEQLKTSGVEIPIQLNAGTVMGEATTMQGYFMTLLGAGHHMYNFAQEKWIVSSPAILEALEFYAAIYGDGLGDAAMQLAENGREQSFEAFAQGRIAILVEGDFFWRSVLFEQLGVEDRAALVDWAKMPAREPGAGINGQDFVSISGGGGWVLNPNTAEPELAWELLSFMAGLDAVRAFQIIQPRISYRDDVETAGDAVMTEMAAEILPLSTVRPQLPAYPQISREAQLMTERVITGEMTPLEAMQAYDAAVTELVGDTNVIRIPLE